MQKSAIQLTPVIFKVLYDELLTKLATKYDVQPDHIPDYQLFGYANFDEQQASIKKLVYDETKQWINGKYLYNKHQQYNAGEKRIGLSREYIHVFFQALGYKNFDAFIQNSPNLQDHWVHEQLKANHIPKEEQDEHFIGYYVGEDSEVITTYLRVYNDTRSAEWHLYYWEQHGAVSEYKYYGKVNVSKNSISIHFPQDDSEVSRSAFLSIFHQPIKFKSILNGCYNGFDKKMRPVSGEILFIRQNAGFRPSPDLIKKVDPVYIQHLTNKRIVVDGQLSVTPLQLSAKAQFASQLSELVGSYAGIMTDTSGEAHFVALEIPENTMKCTVQTDNNLYHGYLKPLANGVLNGEFSTLSEDEKISFYLKTPMKNTQVISGKMSGFSKFFQVMYADVMFSRNNDPMEQLVEAMDMNRHKSPKIPGHTENNRHIEHLVGTYHIHSAIKTPGEEVKMTISQTGEVTLHEGSFVYRGSATLYGFSIMAVDLKCINDEPTPSQLLLFVGRAKGHTIAACSGLWQYLDEWGQPAAKRIFAHHDTKPRHQVDSLMAKYAVETLTSAHHLQLSN